MSDITGLRTETGKIYEETKDAKSGAPRYTQEVVTGPIHYKEAYRDSDPWLDLDASYSETSEIKGVGKVLVYPKMPNIVIIYQDRCGYKIQSRSNPDHIATVELVSIDGQEVTAWQKTDALNVYARVHPYRVGIWKDFSGAARAKATMMRWKVTEKGSSEKDSHPFAFRENPEAFNTADLTDLSPEGLDAAKVAIETARTRIDDNSWYWDEKIPTAAKLVDTDWVVGSSANDGRWYGTSNFTSSDSTCYLGKVSTSTNNSYYRFTSVNITQYSTINSASMSTIASADSSSTECYLNVCMNLSGNAVAPTTHAEADALSLSSAVAWTPGSWGTGTTYSTPSIVTPVQEIVNLATWSSGNAMMVLILDNGSTNNNYRRSYHYDLSDGYCPNTFSVTWTLPSSGHPASKRMAGVPFAAMRRGVW